MRRLVSVLFAIGLLCAPAVAAAQDEGREQRLALAERAIQASQADQMADQMLAIMQAFPRPSLDRMTPQERIALDEVMAETMDTMMIRMVEGMTGVYADLFTLEELEAMAVFYESPIGQSIITKSMQATPQIIELVRALMPDMMRQMVNGMCDRLECSPAERRQALQEVMAGLGMVES